MTVRHLGYAELGTPPDGLTQPGLAASAGLLPPHVAFPLALYLREAPTLTPPAPPSTDLLDPARTGVVPHRLHTDGLWVWDAAVAYYVDNHGTSVPAEFLAHVQTAGWQAPPVSPARLNEVAQALIGLPR